MTKSKELVDFQSRIVAAVEKLGKEVSIVERNQSIEYTLGSLVVSIAKNHETEEQVRKLEVLAENFAPVQKSTLEVPASITLPSKLEIVTQAGAPKEPVPEAAQSTEAVAAE
jgi:hypothetical protein